MTKRDWPETLDITNWEEAIRGHPDHERYHKEYRAYVDAKKDDGRARLPVGAGLLYLRTIMGQPEFSWYCLQLTRSYEIEKEAFKRTSDNQVVWAIVDDKIPGFRRSHLRLAAFTSWFAFKLRLNDTTMLSLLHKCAEWMLVNRQEPTADNLRRAYKQVHAHPESFAFLDFSR
jgi:hypothetical protein